MNESPNISINNEEEVPNKKTFEGNKRKEWLVLHVEQIAAYWNFERIHKFIHEITTNQKIIDGINFLVLHKSDHLPSSYTKSGGFLVRFKNAFTCKMAYDEWSAIASSRQIVVKYDLDNLWEKRKFHKKPFGPRPLSMDEPMAKKQKFYDNAAANTSNKYETYGLSQQFLSNLKIKLPLRNRVFITNLHPDVTETKLREVFGLAGQIVHAIIIKKDAHDPPKLFAKVEYDHPVEAVQAISMFHNQQLYQRVIVVHMDNKPYNDVPEGLSDIGPGLGPNGEPLRGIRNYIELEPLKQLLKNISTAPKTDDTNKSTQCLTPFIQSDAFTSIASNSGLNAQLPMVAQTPIMATQIPISVQASNQQPINPFGQSTIMTPFNISAMQNLQMLQTLNQQNPATFQQAVNTLLQGNVNTNVASPNTDAGGNTSSEWQSKPTMSMQNDNTQPNFSAMESRNNSFGYSHSSDHSHSSYGGSSKFDIRDNSDSRKSSREDDKYNNDKSDMLIFKNLPRSVTLQALKNKMQEVGDLKFAEMTGQGRAIVRFVNTKDAEYCIKLFDRSKVDGQTIDVRYF